MKTKALLFYLTFPFIYLIACLPFKLLYVVSDVFYFLLTASNYRKKVVLSNLKNSFPHKTQAEIIQIKNEYYRYLCDLFLETFKALKMTKEEVSRRCTFQYEPWLQDFFKEKRSIIVIMGHYGNWEWAGHGFTLKCPYQLHVIYKPLSNLRFEKLTTKIRTKFGTKIVPMNLTLREMVANRKEITATAFIADQTPAPENAIWLDFLNQDTAFYTGPEKLARKFNYPVVFMDVQRVSRGYYQIIPDLLMKNSKDSPEGEITKLFAAKLEQQITLNPATWLWSHRRWKHRRENVHQ